MSVATHVITHATDAVANLLSFLKNKPNLTSLSNAVQAEVQAAEDAAWALLTQRYSLNTSVSGYSVPVGLQLNGLGDIVGVSRTGTNGVLLSDALYLLQIIAKIQLNSGSGRINDILSMLLSINPGVNFVMTQARASFYVVPSVTVANPDLIGPMMRSGTASGVAAQFIQPVSPSTPATAFKYAPSGVLVASTSQGYSDSNYVATWTARTAANANSWRSIVWSPEKSLFVAVNQGGTNQTVMTSPDGITWTQRTGSNTNSTTYVTWSPTANGTGLFCAVANNGIASTQFMTSPDGITWTARTSPNVVQWSNITWSPALTLFCAVANSGVAAQRIMTSPDGITWTNRTAPNAVQWYGLVWSPEASLFCAVALDGTTAQQIMTSPNGITWTARTSPSAQQWFGVAWSPILLAFCGVSSSGTAAQSVMMSTGIGGHYVSSY